MTQIKRVYNAFASGCRSTSEASAMTGLPVKHCSAYVRELVRIGKLRDLGVRTALRGSGRPSHWYEPKEEGA